MMITKPSNKRLSGVPRFELPTTRVPESYPSNYTTKTPTTRSIHIDDVNTK